MGLYKLRLSAEAESEFRAVAFPFRRQINLRLSRLKTEPYPADAERIAETESMRLPVGSYAILYVVEEERLTVTVLAIR